MAIENAEGVLLRDFFFISFQQGLVIYRLHHFHPDISSANHESRTV
jgi:hypothetical protein